MSFDRFLPPFLALVCCLVLTLPAYAQAPTVLATVNGAPITAEEFRARYALTIYPHKDQPGMTPMVKWQVLYALIAERLLEQEARRRGFDAEDRFRRNYRLAEEMFVRDKLYRDSVRAVVRVSEDDVRARFRDERSSVEVEFIRADSEERIRHVHALLHAGMSFDTVLMEQQRMAPDAEAATSPVESELLSAAAKLRPGQVSAPVRIGDFWYLLRKRDTDTVLRGEEEYQRRRPALVRDIRAEREADRSAAFVRSCWRGDSATIAPYPYRAIGDALLRDYRAQYRADTSDMLLASEGVFEQLRSEWAPRHDTTFAAIGVGRMTVGEFLDRLQALDLRLKRGEVRLFPRLYEQRVREVLDRHILTRRGYDLGLQQSDEVRRDMAMWAANGLAQMMPELLWEQFIADDDSVWQMFLRQQSMLGPAPEVLLLEVLCADSSEAVDALRALDAGEDFRTLARERSIRDGASARNGEFGWFGVTEHGVLGRTAFGLRVGERAGPIPHAEGWSVIELLGKRRKGAGVLEWADLRTAMEEKLRAGFEAQRAHNLVRSLAGREAITIDAAAVERTPVASMQMFTLRFLGFGGRIPAMPSIMPLHEAVIEGMSSRVDP